VGEILRHVTMALGLVQVVIDGTYCAVVVLLASCARRWLSSVALRHRLERILGTTLIGLGVDLAAATR
jgi:threonine/homoserine/homoserine lactone efflux protein